MKLRNLSAILLVPTALLLIPAIAMQFSDEVNWGPGDFAIAWILLAGVGLAYQLVAYKDGSIAYRAATGLALAGALLLIWINLAVGFIGSEDNPANLLYGAVLVVGAIGAAIARFAPLGMAKALLAAALAQFLVPVVALVVWRPGFDPGVVKVFALNFFFVLIFACSGFLYWHAARQSDAPPAPSAA